MRVVVITRHGGPEVLQVAGAARAPAAARAGPDPRRRGRRQLRRHDGARRASTRTRRSRRASSATRWPAPRRGRRGRDGARGRRPRHGGHAVRRLRRARSSCRQADAIPLPDALSFEQGAAIPVNYATAWAALLGYGSLREGERVLIHAAAGGVGIAATQIAKRYGAEVWGTASPGKHDAIRAHGVDHPLDYTRDGWERACRRSTSCSTRSAGRRSAHLQAAARRRAARRLRRLERHEGEKRNLLKVAARRRCRCPRLQPHRADAELQGRSSG